ncbi:MAG: hypothetical protein IIW01_11070, partial [Thermoguttaceae bacterium]|nr:hypothetical protein [Thermoguttaceae bacterium]
RAKSAKIFRKTAKFRRIVPFFPVGYFPKRAAPPVPRPPRRKKIDAAPKNRVDSLSLNEIQASNAHSASVE